MQLSHELPYPVLCIDDSCICAWACWERTFVSVYWSEPCSLKHCKFGCDSIVVGQCHKRVFFGAGTKSTNGAHGEILCWVISYKMLNEQTDFVVYASLFLYVCPYMLDRSGVLTLSQLYAQQLKNSNHVLYPLVSK